MQVLKVRRRLNQYIGVAQREFRKVRRDLERFFASHMKRFPALVPYTKRPYISWITYALVVGPVLLVVLPLLGDPGGCWMLFCQTLYNEDFSEGSHALKNVRQKRMDQINHLHLQTSACMPI